MHDLYLATDVLALADIIEEFRRQMREVTGLDLLHSLTLPKASWIGALKKSGVRIELVCDEELFQAVDIVNQVAAKVPSGEVAVKVSGYPEGEYFSRCEQPRGEVIHKKPR